MITTAGLKAASERSSAVNAAWVCMPVCVRVYVCPRSAVFSFRKYRFVKSLSLQAGGSHAARARGVRSARIAACLKIGGGSGGCFFFFLFCLALMSRGQALFAGSNGRDYSRGEKNGQALRVAFFSSLFFWMRM